MMQVTISLKKSSSPNSSDDKDDFKPRMMASSDETTLDVEPSGKSSMVSGSLEPEKATLEGENEKEVVGSENNKPETEIDAEDNKPDGQDAEEYPKGASLVFIVIALILSIFLASLDMVSWSLRQRAAT